MRIGNKIFVRYVTIDLEVYATVPATKSDFPYIRLIFAKNRAGATFSGTANGLPLERIKRCDVSACEVLSDNTLACEADYPGTSADSPAITKLTRVFKIMEPVTYAAGLAQ